MIVKKRGTPGSHLKTSFIVTWQKSSADAPLPPEPPDPAAIISPECDQLSESMKQLDEEITKVKRRLDLALNNDELRAVLQERLSELNERMAELRERYRAAGC